MLFYDTWYQELAFKIIKTEKMDKLKPPHELKIAGGNLADQWERFLERFRWYLAAVGEDGSEDKKKVAILLTVAGAEAQ